MKNFAISAPSEGDASRIAAIHVAAMNSNILLHAQFPTPKALRNLEGSLASLTMSQLKDPKVGVLAAHHAQSREIVSFIKWDLPALEGNLDDEMEEFKWSDGCCQEYLDEYASFAEEAKQRAIGDLACYRKSSTFPCPATN